jgi:hypothetical protein
MIVRQTAAISMSAHNKSWAGTVVYATFEASGENTGLIF